MEANLEEQPAHLNSQNHSEMINGHLKKCLKSKTT